MKLIILNGPCGVGKSTIAEKLHASMPLSYLVDVDAVSRNISHYRDYKEERRELTLTVARAMMDAVLSSNRDVIVDKMVYDPAILDSYHTIANKYHAEVFEIILWAPKDVVMQRANVRGWHEGGLLTPEKCEMFWNKIDELKANRPKAKVVDTSKLNEDEAFQLIKDIIT